jgi:hypothetical protein
MPYEGENTDVVICEGLPDALSIWRCGAMRCRVLGLPGVDTLRHLKFPKGTKVTVVPDGDPEDSPARKALDAGVDALMLAECDVRRCTIPPVGWDANRFLVEHGVDGLKTFLSSAVPATLSFDGEIQRLAKLSKIDYERARKQAVKDLKDRDLGDIRVSILDDLVEKAREAIKRAAEKAAAGPDWSTVTGDPVELVVILDGILKELKRYVVAPETTLGVVTLWAAFTHLVHHPIISVQIAPRLAVQAKTPGSGKSVLLELLANVVHNPRLGSSFTASSILRIVGQVEPTMLLDEAHNVLRRDRTDELLAVCNASHRRSGAFVERSVQNPAGEWEVVRFSLWCTMALALNGDLPQEQQERSIVAWLDKVLAEAVPEQLENGVSPELVERQSELKVWARYLEELPKPVLPGILKRQPGRVSDNWRPLAGIAELAGGRWPGLVKDAIEAALTAEHEASTIERLLLSIRRAFDNLPTDYKTGKPVDRIATAELLKVLLVDVEEDWRTANRGREITQYWLRDSLRGLLKPPRAQKWETSEGGNRRHHRGYLRLQFENAWRTYLPEAAEYSSPPPSPATAGSAGSAEGIDNTGPTSATSSDGHTIVSAGNGDFAASTTADAELTAADAAADDSLDYSAISMTPAHTAGPADMVEGGKEKKRNGGDVSNGTARSNGDAPSSRKRTSKSSVDELVVATWRAHPDWSHIKIGKECAVTATKARRIIDAAKAAGDCESDDPGAQVPASSNNALVENAVTYFQEDVQHRSWILQRIGEEPRPLKGESAHVKWVVDFWNAGAAEQAEIARRIKALKLDA